MSASWTDDELKRIGDATELELAARRDDGSLRSFTTMWVVRVGEGLYVRSAGGPDRPWYRHALASRRGRIRAGGVEADVDFVQADPGIHEGIDAAYHAKYDRWGPDPVGHVTGLGAHGVTILLLRRDETT
ncbi:MAG: DUF2255 family protein [Acidimicrobiales bacterium]